MAPPTLTQFQHMAIEWLRKELAKKGPGGIFDLGQLADEVGIADSSYPGLVGQQLENDGLAVFVAGNSFAIRLTAKGTLRLEESAQPQSDLGSNPPACEAKDPGSVFVVHGRDEALRAAMFSFLRAVGLRPIEWTQAVDLTRKGSPTIPEILAAAFSKAQAVVVLFSGDDEARLREHLRRPSEPNTETQLTPQSRPNVIFEAGMAFGYCPDRTILVEVGGLRPFSDVAGRHVVRLDNSSATRQALAQRLKTVGCTVDLSGTDWHNAGTFSPSG